MTDKEKAGAEHAEPEHEDFETIVVTSNEWDGHMAMCQLVNAELERIHKIMNEFDPETPIRKSQVTMLKKYQDRALELTALES